MMVMTVAEKRIVIFVDYRGQFYSSLRVSTGGMDLDVAVAKLTALGYTCELRAFGKFDPTERFDNVVVLYQSSEDRGLVYKSFIHDVLLQVEKNGGVLLPRLDLFHAHENKVYQAFLLQGLSIDKLNVPASTAFGCYEELVDSIPDFKYPVVVKASAGCQSVGVRKANDSRELLRVAKSLSSTFNVFDALRFLAKSYVRPGYVKESLNRGKLVIQEFVSNLDGDYKVLVYGDTAFALSRRNRPNDFRASGSGLFSYERETPSEVLEAAWQIREHFNCPYISIDLAIDKETRDCYLIELQFLMFGTYTLEKAPFCFERSDRGWQVSERTSILEEEFARSISQYFDRMPTLTP